MAAPGNNDNGVEEPTKNMISNTRDLQDFVARARKADAVAFDTEFVWERTYYPQLGLIQVALSDEDCELIDPLAIADLSPLGELLSDRKVVKILHDAPQDLAILHQATGAAPQNVFDTRLAAGFSDLPATLSLSKLIKELLDIDLPKTETRTNWLQRPLNEQQIAYALDDVRYLRAVRILLLSRMIGPKIKSWLQDELNLLNNPQSYLENGGAERYRKIRGAGTLCRQALAILRDLYTWREEEAIHRDRPRGHIVKDAILVNIARRKLTRVEDLMEKAGLSQRACKRYGQQIVTLTAATIGADEQTYPAVHRPTRLSSRDQESFERLTNLIALKCSLLGIDPMLVGNNSELKVLAKLLGKSKSSDIPQLRQTQGWRKDLLQDFFRHSR